MKAWSWVTPFAALGLLVGCQSLNLPGVAGDPFPVSEEAYLNTAEPERLGREHFARGNYGLAERYFRAAVEKAPQNGESWIGLAASYDHLKRFDLADRAYDRAATLTGETALWLNNRGYSYLLRGDAYQAEGLFQRALAIRPDSATIQNNIALMKRAPAVR